MAFPPLYDEKCNDQTAHCFRITVTFGTAAISSYKAKGVTMSRTGVGVYQLTLAQPYLKFQKYPVVSWAKAAGTAVLVPVVNDQSTLGTTGVFSFTLVAPVTGTATEPANGDLATIEFIVTQDPENNATGG
jgi:hypothetical protein